MRIDINNPQESLEKINACIAEDQWRKCVPAIEEARNLVLHKYQIFPHLSSLISSHYDEKKEKKNITIPAYKRSASATVLRLKYKLKKKLRILETS